MKILILAANPRMDLNLDDEVRLVRRVIERSSDRNQFEIVSEPGVRIEDLQFLLLQHKPQIVHFCGHGSGEEGLIFKTEEGGEKWVKADALAGTFKLNPVKSQVRCVILNACYSEVQANAIVKNIDYVVGMRHEVPDGVAIAFAKGFYVGLGEGCSIEDAFECGKNAIQLEITGSSKVRSGLPEQQRKLEVVNVVETKEIPEHLKPILLTRKGLLKERSTIAQPVPRKSREESAKILLEVDQSLVQEETILDLIRNKVRGLLADYNVERYENDLIQELAFDAFKNSFDVFQRNRSWSDKKSGNI